MRRSKAVSHHLYWFGPGFLHQSVSCWLFKDFKFTLLEEILERELTTKLSHLEAVPNLNHDWLECFSSFTRITRTVVYIRQFITLVKGSIHIQVLFGVQNKRIPLKYW